jgi:hypothetical protein
MQRQRIEHDDDDGDNDEGGGDADDDDCSSSDFTDGDCTLNSNEFFADTAAGCGGDYFLDFDDDHDETILEL